MNRIPFLTRLAPGRSIHSCPVEAKGAIRESRWLPRIFRVGNGRGLGSRMATAALALGFLVGCDSRDAVRVGLHVRPAPGGSAAKLEVQAQLNGSLTGLRYKWFAVSGGCDPQESESPTTLFVFADGTVRDRISVELWRKDRRVGQAEIDVRLDPEQVGRLSKREPPVEIQITEIPPSESGGPDTRASISGKVGGEIEPGDRVVLYAFAYDYWHIQPIANATHPIAPNHTWSNWTHTGTSYAALVVEAGYEPRIRLDLLPRVGGSVLARTVVEGKK